MEEMYRFLYEVISTETQHTLPIYCTYAKKNKKKKKKREKIWKQKKSQIITQMKMMKKPT